MDTDNLCSQHVNENAMERFFAFGFFMRSRITFEMHFDVLLFISVAYETSAIFLDECRSTARHSHR